MGKGVKGGCKMCVPWTAAGRPKLTVGAQVTELMQCWTLLRFLVAEFSVWGVFVLRIVVYVEAHKLAVSGAPTAQGSFCSVRLQ